MPLRRMLLRTLTLGLTAAVLAPSCVTTTGPSRESSMEGLPHAYQQFYRERIVLWVKGLDYDPGGRPVIVNPGGAIKQFHWDDPKRLIARHTRKDLLQMLLNSHGQWIAPAHPDACVPTLEDCLLALQQPQPCTPEMLQRWTGIHRDVNRDGPAPDDARWDPPQWHEENQYWAQQVTWMGDAPRQGWNRCDSDGLYGWDPKIPGEGATSDDGQSGAKGTNVGYPVTLDESCECIIWISPKEAYLECINAAGLRTAAGLTAAYAWQVEPLPQ